MSYLPHVIESVPGGERAYDLPSRLLKDRTIFLGDEVNNHSANSIVMQMLFLAAQDPKADIYFYINSPGGAITAGMAIYDTMQHISCDVHTICVGMAASMGAFLLAGGTKGKRHCLPNAEVMIHQPLGGAQGQATDIQIAAEHIHAVHGLNCCNKLIGAGNAFAQFPFVDRGSANNNSVFFKQAAELCQTNTCLISCPCKPLSDSIFLLFGGGIIFISMSGVEGENLLLACVSHK